MPSWAQVNLSSHVTQHSRSNKLLQSRLSLYWMQECRRHIMSFTVWRDSCCGSFSADHLIIITWIKWFKTIKDGRFKGPMCKICFQLKILQNRKGITSSVDVESKTSTFCVVWDGMLLIHWSYSGWYILWNANSLSKCEACALCRSWSSSSSMGQTSVTGMSVASVHWTWPRRRISKSYSKLL